LPSGRHPVTARQIVPHNAEVIEGKSFSAKDACAAISKCGGSNGFEGLDGDDGASPSSPVLAKVSLP